MRASKNMYEPALVREVSQGDIFDNLPVVFVVADDGEVELRVWRCALLTRDCEFDKPVCKTIQVAPVIELASVDRGQQQQIRDRIVKNTFYLQEAPGILEESYIDLRIITTLTKAIVERANENGHRILSLDEKSRKALQ